MSLEKGGGVGRGGTLRIRPTVRDDSFQPARASVRAIRSFPPNPASSIVLTTALTTSAKRRTGGFGATRERGPSSLGFIASISHRAIVSTDTRNMAAVSRCDRPRKLRIRRIRNLVSVSNAGAGAMGIAAGVGAHRPVALPSFACPAGDKALTPQPLEPDDSSAASRSRAAYSLGPPRSEPSTRGSFRKSVDYTNLNRRPDRALVYRAGLRRKLGRASGFYAPHTPGNSHCAPTPHWNSRTGMGTSDEES
jgi:hypothetical protein